MKAEDESVTLTLMSVIFPVMGILTNSVLSFGVKLAEKVGFKTMIFGGGFTISLAFLILSFIRNIGAFIFVYCVFVGISTGLVYMLPIRKK
jgi:MFS transporter, OFA family, oxalate/formate antiporter